MKFEFAKYTEITDLVFELQPHLKEEGFERFFICPDVWDNWYIRIVKGYDEEYEKDSDSYIMERNKIEKERKTDKLSLKTVKEIILEDDGSNWDYKQSYDINELIDMLDNGFGINHLKDGNNNQRNI